MYVMVHGIVTDSGSVLGPDGSGCEICPGHSKRGQRHRNPHEVHQEN